MWLTVLGLSRIKAMCLAQVPLGNLKGKNKINNYTTSQLEGRGFHWWLLELGVTIVIADCTNTFLTANIKSQAITVIKIIMAEA